MTSRLFFPSRNVARCSGDISLRDGGREAIGALVRVWYSDGSVSVRRYGSAHSSAFSQVLEPLHFGIPAGSRVEKLAVRWPGDREDSVLETPTLNQLSVLERAR